MTYTLFMAKVMFTYCTYCKSYVHIPHILITAKDMCTYCNALCDKRYVHIPHILIIAKGMCTYCNALYGESYAYVPHMRMGD